MHKHTGLCGSYRTSSPRVSSSGDNYQVGETRPEESRLLHRQPKLLVRCSCADGHRCFQRNASVVFSFSIFPFAVSLLVRRISYLKRKEKDKESEKAYAGMPTQEERGRSENTKHTIVFRDFIKPCTLRSKSFMTRKGERVTRIEIRGESWYLFRRKPFVRLAIVFWYLTLAVTAASRSRR